jgi:hypothetical protein
MRSQPSRSAIALVGALALVAVLAVVASGALGRSPDPSAPASPIPTVAPSLAPVDPTPRPVDPTPAPTPTPSPTHAANGQFEVDLDIADGHDVSVAVDDDSGRIVGVSSGQGGDGMSVRWSDIEIVNLDPDTLQITFVGFPQDEMIAVGFDVAAGDGFNLTISQQLPLPNTDALGADRVLVIDLDGAVDAGDIYAAFVAA